MSPTVTPAVSCARSPAPAPRTTAAANPGTRHRAEGHRSRQACPVPVVRRRGVARTQGRRRPDGLEAQHRQRLSAVPAHRRRPADGFTSRRRARYTPGVRSSWPDAGTPTSSSRPSGPLGWVLPTLQRERVNVIAASASDVFSAASAFAAAVDNGRRAHDRDPDWTRRSRPRNGAVVGTGGRSTVGARSTCRRSSPPASPCGPSTPTKVVVPRIYAGPVADA